MTDWALGLGAIAGAILAIAGVWRLTRPVRRGLMDLTARASRAFDVVLGTPAVTDPDTGRVVIPAREDIGIRTTRMEAMLEQVLIGSVEKAEKTAQDAVERAVAAQAGVEQLTEQVTEVSRKVDELTGRVESWQTEDRVRAETATSVLAEVGHNIGALPKPKETT